MPGHSDRLIYLLPEVMGALLIYGGTAKIGNLGKVLSDSLLVLDLHFQSHQVIVFGFFEVMVGIALALTSIGATVVLTIAIGLLFATFGLIAEGEQ